jgi:putative ABC transport system substrate-binding protein
MRRREFITLLGGAAATWPLTARAQQPMPVVGYLGSTDADKTAHILAAFRQGLNETGHVEGKNIAIEYRFAEGQYQRLPILAADLVHRHVAVLVAGGGPAARAAKAATTSIPIVFNVGVDPIASELVASIGRPGGNATGTSVVARELNAKKLELLRELVPAGTIIGVLLNPSNPNHEILSQEILAAATRLGQRILVLHVRTEDDFDMTFVNLREQHAHGLVVTDDPLFSNPRTPLIALAARHNIPTIYPWREQVEAGGLISHGPSITQAFRQVGIYTGQILKGAKPADLPVFEPTRFETVLNLKTAKALGLDLPTTTLLRADEVIE